MATTVVKGSGIHVIVYDERDQIVAPIRNSLVEPVVSFTNLGSCMSYIDEVTKNNEAAVVVTPSLEDRVLRTFESSEPIEAVFVLSSTNRSVSRSLTKVVGVYTRVDELLQTLCDRLESIESRLNTNSMLFHLDEEGGYNYNFFFYQLWLTHELRQTLTKQTLVEQANLLFRQSKQMRAAINEFDTSYRKSDALRWIDKNLHPFPYYLLATNALRTHDQRILGILRFFILDINRQLKLLSSIKMTTQAFYGGLLPMAAVERLERQAQMNIVAFQCFLPATKTRSTAVAIATQPTNRRKMISVLFKIEAAHAHGIHMGNITLIDMATPFRVISVSRYAGFTSGEQIGAIVQLVALDHVERRQLYEDFVEQQKKEGRTIEDFLSETVPLLR